MIKRWRQQVAAYRFAQHKPAAMISLGLGAGKSRVAVDLVQTDPLPHGQVLILCPKSVIDVWPVQFQRYATVPDDYRVVTLREGSVTQRLTEAKNATMTDPNGSVPVLVLNYEAAWREPMRSWLLAQQWDFVILDESHRIKGAGGKRSLFAKTLASRANRRLCLTGTPMPHSPQDLYAQCRFLDASVFGTRQEDFLQRYAIRGGFDGRQIIAWQRQEEMNQKFRTIAYESSDEELELPPLLDLPPRTTDLEPAARRIYTDLKREFIAETDAGVVTASNALVKLLRFQQITGGFLTTDDKQVTAISTAKIDLLDEVLSELSPDEPIVIFCRFTAEIALVADRCRHRGRLTAELSGRRNELQHWQQSNVPVLVVQIQAGSEGIDLTRARTGIYYSYGFSNGDYRQSRKRLHRPGQTRPVRLIHLEVRNTVDQQVRRALRKRQDVVTSILKAGLI